MILRESAPVAASVQQDRRDEKNWAYHGGHQWQRGSAGVLPAESSVWEMGFTYNDLDSVRTALEACAGDCAAVFVGGASYPYSNRTVQPTPEFARGVRQLASEYGALLVLDEIRTNFRVGDTIRGHWCGLSEQNDGLGEGSDDVAPDMYCLCKALGNGHPVSALVGNEAARNGAATMTATGTYWVSGAPMAAALATLDVLQADNSAAMHHMQAMGERLCAGIAAQALRHGFSVTLSGPPAMPFVTFDADDGMPARRPLGMEWCTAVAQGGVWLHPFHNWYLSLSHTEEDIDEALEATDAAFAHVASRHTSMRATPS